MYCKQTELHGGYESHSCAISGGLWCLPCVITWHRLLNRQIVWTENWCSCLQKIKNTAGACLVIDASRAVENRNSFSHWISAKSSSEERYVLNIYVMTLGGHLRDSILRYYMWVSSYNAVPFSAVVDVNLQNSPHGADNHLLSIQNTRFLRKWVSSTEPTVEYQWVAEQLSMTSSCVCVCVHQNLVANH